MAWVRVMLLPEGTELREFDQWLARRRIPHRFTEEGGMVVLWAPDTATAQWLSTACQAYLRGELSPEVDDAGWMNTAPPPAPSVARLYPVTLVLLALSIAGWALVSFGPLNVLVPWLSYQAFSQEVAGAFQWQGPAAHVSGELWRLFTPAFLHFGLLHIAFNGLWLWDLGRRIEGAQGSWRLFTLFLWLAWASNTAQFLWDPATLFGGMSGVIYGLLGFIWFWNRGRPDQPIPLAPEVLRFMLIWLVICMTNLLTALGLPPIANAAHVAGLLAGVLTGALSAMLSKRL